MALPYGEERIEPKVCFQEKRKVEKVIGHVFVLGIPNWNQPLCPGWRRWTRARPLSMGTSSQRIPVGREERGNLFCL